MNKSSLLRVLGRGLIPVAALSLLAGCATQQQYEPPTDFSGFWFVSEHDEIIRPHATAKYTEEAKERMAFYEENFDVVEESPAKFCDQPGMPGMLGAIARDYPREIYQTEDRIFYLFEYMDIYRVIRIGETEVPENFPGSENGYSIAHWEGDELVVVTEGFTDTAYVDLGIRSSEAKVVERWRLIDHPKFGESIEIEYEVTDPVIYEEPAYGRALYKRGEEGTVLGMYNCPGTLWENYVWDKMQKIEAEKEAEQEK